MKPFALLVFTLLCFPLFAQDYIIKGHVVDSISGQSLPAANIILQNPADSLFIKGTITNENGDFIIRRILKKSYNITVTYLGYRSHTVNVIQDENPIKDLRDISLVPESTLLNEIMVKWKPLLEYGDEGSVILNLDVLGNLETLSVADAMESVPGFYFDFDDEPVYNGISNYTILIDGERIGHSTFIVSSEGGYLYTLKNIPAKYIKKVEIYPEPSGKYGFFTPIINLVPNGDLMDTYKAHAALGLSGKYVGRADFSKKTGKFTLKSGTEYADKHKQTTTLEDRVHKSEDKSNNFSRKTVQHNSSDEGNLGFSIRYMPEKGSWIEAGLGGKLLTAEDKSKKRMTNYASGIENESESYHSEPESYNASGSVVRFFRLPKSQMIRLLSDLKYNFSNTEESQNLSSLYQQKTKNNNTNVSLKANYSNMSKKTYWVFDLGLSYQNSYNFSERKLFNSEENEWTSVSAYSRDTRLQRLNSNLNLRISRNFRKDKRTQTLRLSVVGTWNNDLINNYIEKEKTSNDNFRTSNSFYYWNSRFLKQSLTLDYKNNVSWPSSDKLFSTPVYINKQTIQVGNPDLNPETKTVFSIQLRNGFDPNAGYINVPRVTNWGYSFKCAYQVEKNEIVNNQTLKGDNILVYSFANNDSHYSWNAGGNMYYNLRNKIKMYMGGEFASEKYNDNPAGYQNDNNWNAYAKVRTNVFFNMKLELKYRYNSPHVVYRSKVHDYQDASASLSRHFLKNNLYVVFEITDILSKKGIRTEYFGNNFYSNKIVCNEYPVVWLRVSYVLFSFYSKNEMDY